MELIIVLFRDAFFSLYAWTSVLVTLSAGFLWAYIINKIPLSIAYPMASMTYIIMIYADYYFFGIDITMNKVIGVLLVISGIICIVRA
jgi:drug/metabolite transporter (DMT)-like permease